MKIIKPYTVIESEINSSKILKSIERAARTCYKSEGLISEDDSSAKKIVSKLIQSGHEAMLEHESITIRFTCDRGVSHELVRHRVASFAQESTRYCNYGKFAFGNEITVIDISQIMKLEVGKTVIHPITKEPTVITCEMVQSWISVWLLAMQQDEEHYMTLINDCCPAQLARSVLSNSLKTEIVVTMNLREIRHFFGLRCAKAAHPQMRELTIPLLAELKTIIPIIFDDIEVK